MTVTERAAILRADPKYQPYIADHEALRPSPLTDEEVVALREQLDAFDNAPRLPPIRLG